MRKLVTLLVFLLFALPLKAETIDLSLVDSYKDLISSTYVLNEKSNNLTSHQLLNSSSWELNKKSTLHGGLSKNPFWLKYNLTNSSNLSVTKWFALGSTRLEHINFYLYNEEQELIASAKTGSQVAKDQHLIPATTARLFPVTLTPNQQLTLIIEIKSETELFITSKVYEPLEYKTQEHSTDIKTLISIFTMLVAGIYLLIASLARKDRLMTIMAGWIVAYGTYILAYNGYLHFYLLTAGGSILAATPLIFGLLTAIFMFIFFRAAFQAKNNKLIYILINFAIVFYSLVSLYALIDLHTAIFISHSTALFYIALQPIITFSLWKHRLPNTELFLAASLVFFFIFSYRVLNVSGLVDLPLIEQPLLFSLTLLTLTLLLAAGFTIRSVSNLKEQIATKNKLINLQEEQQETLEIEVANRTQELELALSARRNLLAHISHDLRSPLAGMLASLNNWQAGNTEYDYPELIKSYAKQQLSLIDELLEFSRSELTKIESQASAGYLANFLDKLNQHSNFLATKEGLTFNTNFSVNLPATLYLDFKLVHKVLVNLLNNAIKYTKQNSLDIELKTNNLAKQVVFSVELITKANKQLIYFKIDDQAKQLNAEQIKDLQQAFVRGANAGSSEGYGLGLAIVIQLLSALDTELEIYPSELGGNCFAFKLPLVVADESEVNALLEGFSCLDLDGNDQLVLVVDDQPFVREVAADLLSGYGFDAVPCATGQEALDVLRNQEVALLITDQQMPQMHGWELLKQALAIQPQLKTLLYSANLPTPTQGYEALSFTSHLLKPASEESFLQEIQKCLKS